uniref:Cingulin b n=1 Tax=Lates calcarifer TaxID=8187 RepID=A0A4W6FB54_LATCA
MKRDLHGTLSTDRKPLVDYGVQIRFIKDLHDTGGGYPDKSKGNNSATPPSNKYGVAVRVQGISGQPYVVLKDGEKGDSYGVQLNTPAPSSESASPYNSLPKTNKEPAEFVNPYTPVATTARSPVSPAEDEDGEIFGSPLKRPPGDGQAGTQGEEEGGAGRQGQVERAKAEPQLKATASEAEKNRDWTSTEEKYNEAGLKPVKLNGVGPRGVKQTGSGFTSSLGRSSGKKPSTISPSESFPEPPASTDKEPAPVIDTNSLAPINKLISKFNSGTPGSAPQTRGRSGARQRLRFDERRRSRSLDARKDVQPEVPLPSPTSPTLNPYAMPLSSSSNLFTSPAPGSGKGAESRLRLQEDQLAELQEELRRVSENSPHSDSLQTDLMTLQAELAEAAMLRQRQEDTLRQRERELTALKGALKEEVECHDKEMEALREQYGQDMENLRKTMEQVTQSQEQIEEERERVNASILTLEEELESCRDQGEQWKTQLEVTTQELHNTKEELVSIHLHTYILCIAPHRIKRQTNININHICEQIWLHFLTSETRLHSSVPRSSEAEDALEALEDENRSLKSQLEEAKRGATRLSKERDELTRRLEERDLEREALRRGKSDLEEQKRLLDRALEKINKEMEMMMGDSRQSVAALQTQLDDYRERSRKDLLEAQRNSKDRLAELQRAQSNLKAQQEEVSRLKKELLVCSEERDSTLLERDLLNNRLKHLESELETEKSSHTDRSREIRGLEDKIKTMEIELDEERSSVELLNDRIARSRDQVDQLRSELMQERSARHDLEMDKSALERQVKELKSRVADMEGQTRPSAGISLLENKIQELEERLRSEEREKASIQASQRRMERKLKELNATLDQERSQHVEQRDQLSLRVKALKRQVDESEGEVERLEGVRRKVLRDLEEQQELQEALQAKVTALEAELKRKSQQTHRVALGSSEDEDGFYDTNITSILSESHLPTSN